MMAGERRAAQVLVVDDEPTALEIVSRYLRRAGYSTLSASNGPEAVRLAGEERPDLVVLDMMLPGLNGFQVMERLDRERTAVIILSAKGAASDRVMGLALGADDYVSKPFLPAELVARIDAVLRRTDQSPARDDPIVFEDLEIDPVARRVSVGGGEVSLTALEFRLLLFLARHPSRVFSRKDLIDAAWRGSHYSDATVPVCIRRLRAKIEKDPSNPRRLETVWGAGYRFQP